MILSPGEIERLGARGWFLRDGFLTANEARAAHSELATVELRRAGMAKEHFDLDERGDRMAWLDARVAPPALAAVCTRLEALREALARDAWLPTLRAEIQVACYPGGGTRYVRHRDSFAQNNRRRITAIVYLNADWKLADGGHLRIFDGEAGGAMDIEPVGGRLVGFLSERIEHEVLAAQAPRFAITAWCYGP
jgi:SM-20-related protein